MSLKRHTSYNLAGQILPLVLSLLTIPVYLRLIGEARFGVLALIWLFFGYMGLFDLGIGQATARQLAHMPRESKKEHAKVLWTALSISLALGLIGALVTQPLGTWFFSRNSSIEADLRLELLATMPWAAALVPATTLAAVLSGALQARSAFGELNLIGASVNAFALLAPLAVAATFGVQLPGLVAAVAAVRLLVLIPMLWRCGTHYLVGSPLSIDGRYASQLLRFGGWTTVSAVAGPLMVVADRFAIGVQLGARSVSHYVIPFQMTERTTVFASALNHALFPRFASARTEVERHQLAMFGLRVLGVWLSPLMATGLLLSAPFLAWWISPELAAQSAGVAQILCLAFWINSLTIVPFTKLLASGRPDLVAKSHMIELLPYLALLYVALQTWGLVGVAAAFAARVTVDFLLLSHLAGTLLSTLRLLMIPAALMAALLGLVMRTNLSPTSKWPFEFLLLLALVGWSLMQRRTGSNDTDQDTAHPRSD
ncbi:MAG TPA: flippase [Variovorax sp.]|nr:flippase [Variovorax sp.]